MKRRGFTLTEMLVVVGIVVVLLSAVATTLVRVRHKATHTAIAADLAAIAAALEAYKQDFGDYPRIVTAAGANTPDRPNPPTGAQLLAFALIGPAPEAEPTYTGLGRKKADGADGPGFRPRGTTGRVFGPYLRPDQFRVENPANPSDPNPLTMVLLERHFYEMPILYYPASAARPNIRSAKGYVGDYDYRRPPGTVVALYNARDNPELPFDQLARMLGDYNGNGMIDAGEQPATEAPFLLWAAGGDGIYGMPRTLPLSPPDRVRKAVSDVDDVTNFNR
jgi:prepilin-type N-terminal cleavage/methylation domain-containing protein